jgi:LacI family transcriptional regulator
MPSDRDDQPRPDGPAAGTAGVTIYQVAAHAGVSITTVSRVMRDSGPVAAETRDRVLDAIDRLRFVPSRLGRGLAERRHAANGIVFPDLAGPYYAEVVVGYEEVAAELGRSVLILSTHGREAVRGKVLDLASRVDGLVIFGRTVRDDVVTEVVAMGVPVVLLARPAVAGVDTISTENLASARHLAGHLLDHGYRRLAFLGDPSSSSDAAARWEGVSAVLAERGIRPRRPVVCAFSEEAGRTVARRLLAAGRGRPQALVCTDDEIALGALLAAEELGLRVPGDVAVTGWDDIMAARYARPGLTTVRQPMRELGGRAARALDERIGGARAAPRHDVLHTEVVIRASCGDHGDQGERGEHGDHGEEAR